MHASPKQQHITMGSPNNVLCRTDNIQTLAMRKYCRYGAHYHTPARQTLNVAKTLGGATSVGVNKNAASHSSSHEDSPPLPPRPTSYGVMVLWIEAVYVGTGRSFLRVEGEISFLRVRYYSKKPRSEHEYYSKKPRSIILSIDF